MECESFLEEVKIGFGNDHLANTNVYVWVALQVTWKKWCLRKSYEKSLLTLLL